MRILVAGDFEPHYNRTKIILDGLQAQGAVLSYYNFKEHSKYNFKAIRAACKAADIIFMPSFTHMDVPVIKLLSGGKPMIFDPLISRYLSKVFDYKNVNRYSPRALKNYLKDKVSMTLADVVVCDTAGHLAYYHETFGVPLKKLKVLPVGVNTDDFKPANFNKNTSFTVGFYGGFIPLQGTKAIIATARLLKDDRDIQFRLIGNGFEFKAMQQAAEGLTNIHFLGWVDYDKLAAEVNAFDICLGIFGETLKADLVIPNKIFHYAALRKAIITKDTPAIREVFNDGKDIVLCEAEASAIAAKILLLKEDATLRERIAQCGYEKITKEYNHIAIGKMLYEIAESLVSRK
jgi:glycosyltransferase involved in cell wall biosynthesis